MKFIFLGEGYTASFLAPLLEKDFELIGTFKNIDNLKKKKKQTYIIKRFQFDEFILNKIQILKETSHILVSIPPNDKGDLALKEIQNELTKSDRIKWIGYFSTTGVYGDHEGNWVNEDSKLRTENFRSLNRIKAENEYLSLFKKFKKPIHIFRLPGIYGPGRSTIDRLRSGSVKIMNKKHQFFSRIHVEDIASCIIESIKKPTPGEIFNLTDNKPCSSKEVILFTCKLMGIKPPEEIDFNDESLNELTKSFYIENKKVSNYKFKKMFKWNPKFFSYREGIKDIFENEDL